jgi:hypothetical protein
LTYNHVMERLVSHSALVSPAEVPARQTAQEGQLSPGLPERNGNDVASGLGKTSLEDGASNTTVGAASPSAPRDHEAELRNGEVLQEFMHKTASQLAFYGLMQLHQHIRERQLCVFFRNNHFCTLFKVNRKLYLLVTDEGYRDEEQVVWELLDDIEGDTEFCTSGFTLCASSSRNDTPIAVSPQREEDPDYLYALSLQSGSSPVAQTTRIPVVLPASAVSVVPSTAELPFSVLVSPQDVHLQVGATAQAPGPVTIVANVVGEYSCVAPNGNRNGDDDDGDDDEKYALMLQQQLNFESAGYVDVSTTPEIATSFCDEQLARILQEQINEDGRREEEWAVDRRRGQAAPTATAETNSKKKNGDCAVQ